MPHAACRPVDWVRGPCAASRRTRAHPRAPGRVRVDRRRGASSAPTTTYLLGPRLRGKGFPRPRELWAQALDDRYQRGKRPVEVGTESHRRSLRKAVTSRKGAPSGTRTPNPVDESHGECGDVRSSFVLVSNGVPGRRSSAVCGHRRLWCDVSGHLSGRWSSIVVALSGRLMGSRSKAAATPSGPVWRRVRFGSKAFNVVSRRPPTDQGCGPDRMTRRRISAARKVVPEGMSLPLARSVTTVRLRPPSW